MLVGNVQRDDFALSLPEIFAKVCTKLKELDLEHLELGWHNLDDQVSFAVVETQTMPSCGRKAEVHRKMVDIHLVVCGEEMIEYGVAMPNFDHYDPYNEADDCQLSEIIDDKNEVVLKAGSFAIFLPNEPHKPLTAVNGEVARVRKVIAKVPVSLL